MANHNLLYNDRTAKQLYYNIHIKLYQVENHRKRIIKINMGRNKERNKSNILFTSLFYLIIF